MTVSSQTSNETFFGNGLTVTWDIPFRFFKDEDIQVYLNDLTSGASVLQVQGTDYTLTGAGLPEQFGTAPGQITTTEPVPTGKALFVERVMPIEQLTDIINQGEFFPEIHEDVFDRITMLLQQIGQDSQGSIKVALGDPTPKRLPPVISRANQLMGFDSLGNPVPVAPYPSSAEGLALDLLNAVDAAKGDAKIGVKKVAAGLTAIPRTQHDVNEESVSLNDFNDIPDAIAWAMSAGGRRCIILPGGELDMSGKKFILPDTSAAEPTSPLYFRSAGGTKIVKGDGGYLFDCAGAAFYDLIVEGLQFEGVQGAGCTLFNTDKLIRLTVERCHSRYIDHYMKGSNYCQTVRMVNNTQRWGQSFCEHLYGYDVWLAGNIIEHGKDGIKFLRSAGDYALLNSVIQSNVIEGMTGVGIQLGACAAVNVFGNYQELNTFYSDFGASGIPHAGLRHHSNWYFMSAAQVAASKFPVATGNHVVAFNSGGNFSNGNLYDNTACTSSMMNLAGGDYYIGQLFKGHTTLSDPARNPINGVHFFEGHKEVWAFNKQTTYIDAVTGGKGFSNALTQVNIGGTLIHPEEHWGGANPQTSPGTYGNRPWAKGSRVHNYAPVVSGTVPNRFIVEGWVCLQSSANLSGDPGVWLEVLQTSFA